MFCVHCGAQNIDGARFCSSCGAPMESSVSPSQAQRQTQAQPQTQHQPVRQTYEATPAYGQAAVAGSTAAARTGLSGGAKALIALLIVVILGAGIFVIYQMNKDPDAGIKETIHNFESAYNRQDFSGLLDCFDPAYTAIYKGAMSLIGGMVGFDAGSLMDCMFGLFSILPEDVTGADQLPDLKITVDTIHYLDEDTADVTVTVILSYGTQQQSENDTIRMICKDKTWYFSGDGIFW